MNYHNITKCDMLNGEGIRVVLWVSGCSLHCKNCQNPQTWDFNSGIPFDEAAKQELFQALSKDYVKGITFSGGHPLEKENISTVIDLCEDIKMKYHNKDIWIYSGYTWEKIIKDPTIKQLLPFVDVLVDGQYIDSQKDTTLHWRGSSNQRVIDVKKSLSSNQTVLLCD